MINAVLEIAKTANIPTSVVVRMIGISRTTMQKWKRDGTPENRIPQLQILQKTIQQYLDENILPKSIDELVWYGLLHITECERTCSKQ